MNINLPVNMSEIKVVKVKFVITNKEHRPKKATPTTKGGPKLTEIDNSITFDNQNTDKQESKWAGLTFEDDAIGLSRDWLVTCEKSLYNRKKK